jgi:hypothetical protein
MAAEVNGKNGNGAASLAEALPRDLLVGKGTGERFRISVDEPGQTLFGSFSFISPPDDEDDWRSLCLDARPLDKESPATLLERLSTLSPEISLALWQFNRFCNPGWEAVCLRPGSETQDKKAQAALDAFLGVLKAKHGSVDVVIQRLFINAFMRGAFVAELVLNNAGREPINLATPDAKWIKFHRVQDPEEGVVFVPYQQQGGRQVELTRPTFRYVPVDPLPGSPYGRALAAPALHASIFTLGILHDLKRVIAQQGWPRFDIKLITEKLAAIMPPDVKGDVEKMRSWITSFVDDISRNYARLQPDQAFVHLDTTELGRPVGAVDSSSLGGVDGIVSLLERMVSRGLKSNALLMGIPEGMSEASANRLYEWHVQGIKSVQHLCEQLLEYLLGLGLQAQGIQTEVRWRFSENRASEELRDQQTLKLKITNWLLAYDAGWASQAQAAQGAMGLDKPDQEEPRIPGVGVAAAAAAAGGSQNPATVQPEPGSNRTLTGSWSVSSGSQNFLLDSSGVTHKVETCQCPQCQRMRDTSHVLSFKTNARSLEEMRREQAAGAGEPGSARMNRPIEQLLHGAQEREEQLRRNLLEFLLGVELTDEQWQQAQQQRAWAADLLEVEGSWNGNEPAP